MEELREKANSYTEENVINVLKEAFAKVYADGYRDGYKDREEEIPVDLRDNKTEYVDLGLKSGTLWSADYEREEKEKYLYIHYDKAQYMSIPTRDQWDELFETCSWEYKFYTDFKLYLACCTGPNGNVIRFRMMGKIDAYDTVKKDEGFFWLKEDLEGNYKSSIRIYNNGYSCSPKQKIGRAVINSEFSGHKLPIRLVKTK